MGKWGIIGNTRTIACFAYSRLDYYPWFILGEMGEMGDC